MQPAFSFGATGGVEIFLPETGARTSPPLGGRRPVASQGLRLEGSGRGGFGGRGKEHFEVGDAILEVFGGGWDEAEGLVERLEVALGAEAHGYFWKVEVAVADAFCDHFFP
jgi:hypothetical protein